MSAKRQTTRAGSFLIAEEPGSISRDAAFLAEGENLQAGTLLKRDDGGDLIAWTTDADCAGILFAGNDARAARQSVAIISRLAVVNLALLTFPDGEEAAARDALEAVRIEVRADHTVADTGGGGGGAYAAKAVQTDGTVMLLNEALSAAGLDNEFFSASFWWKDISGVNGTGTIFVTDPDGAYTNTLDTKVNSPSYDFFDADANNGILGQFYHPNPYANSHIWHHYLISVKSNNPAGTKIATVYIDDVYAPTGMEDTGTAFTMVNDGKKVTVLDDGFGDGVTGEFADLWIAPGVSLLDGGDASRTLSFGTGVTGPAAATLVGATVGTAVLAVIDAGNDTDVSSDFETTISVDDQIQQISTADLSQSGLTVTLATGGQAILEATRRQFIDANGKPVDPVNFPSAAMLFSGDKDGFVINQGAGGSFTVTGTLTNATTSPSD